MHLLLIMNRNKWSDRLSGVVTLIGEYSTIRYGVGMETSFTAESGAPESFESIVSGDEMIGQPRVSI